MRKLNAITVLFGLLLALGTRAWPAWNFDCIGYGGLARVWLGASPQTAQRLVYHDLQSAMPRSNVEELSGSSRFREHVATKADVFEFQLGFYTSRPLYVAPVAALTALGMNSVSACFWVSAVVFGVFAALVAGTLLRVAGPVVGGVLSLLLLLSPPLLEPGRIATPDSLAAALSFAGAAATLFFKRPVSGGVLMLLGVLARPDSSLLMVTVLGWDAARPDATWKDWLRSLALLGAAGVSIILWPHHTWTTLIVHTLGPRLESTDQIAKYGIDYRLYSRLLWRGLVANNLYRGVSLPLLALVTTGGVMAARGAIDLRKGLLLLAVVWGSVVLHYLAFPILTDRYFVAQYALAVVIVGRALTTRRRGSSERSRRSPP